MSAMIFDRPTYLIAYRQAADDGLDPWTFQLGVFRNEDLAARERDRLRGQGFQSEVIQVTGMKVIGDE